MLTLPQRRTSNSGQIEYSLVEARLDRNRTCTTGSFQEDHRRPWYPIPGYRCNYWNTHTCRRNKNDLDTFPTRPLKDAQQRNPSPPRLPTPIRNLNESVCKQPPCKQSFPDVSLTQRKPPQPQPPTPQPAPQPPPPHSPSHSACPSTRSSSHSASASRTYRHLHHHHRSESQSQSQ